MYNFYNLIDTIRGIISTSEFNNKVSFGDITEVDLGKTTNFPLVHMIVDQAAIGDKTIRYTLRVIAMDIVDVAKTNVNDEDYYGNSNVQDILNTQLAVINGVVEQLRRMDRRTNNFFVIGEETICNPFLDRFENELAGWECTLVIESFNDIGIC